MKIGQKLIDFLFIAVMIANIILLGLFIYMEILGA